MVSAILTLLVGASVLLCFYLYLKYTYWKRNKIPTAKGYYPIIGHILWPLLLKTNYADMIEQMYNAYKGYSMVGFYTGTKPVLIVRDPNLIKTVLQTSFTKFHENAIKIEPEADPLLAKNPFANYGDEWVIGRKRLTYAFSSSRLKTLFTAVSGVSKKFKAFLDRRLQSTDKYEVELKCLFSKFTGEVVANAGLGIEGQCFEDNEVPNSFDSLARKIFLRSVMERFIGQIMMFFPEINRILKLPFTPKEVDQFFRQVVAQNLEIRRKETTPRNDFLQLMIDLEKTGDKVDETVLTAHAFSFYADGLETSAITLSLVGYQLAVHQDIQEKLRSEVLSTIQKHGDITYDALKEMKYMDQVISESQRYYPGVNLMIKLCTEETVLEGSDGLTLHVKPGTEIILPIFGLHHDEKYWPDPWKFDPERFNDDNKQNIEKMAFLPFGEGPRMCVGMRMALLQIKACLATLLRNYKIELSSKTQLPLTFKSTFILPIPDGGLWVHVSKL